MIYEDQKRVAEEIRSLTLDLNLALAEAHNLGVALRIDHTDGTIKHLTYRIDEKSTLEFKCAYGLLAGEEC